jgi:allophanate hydrolase subunit 2
MTTSIEVVRAGIATTIQDLGRPGMAHIGVSPSGAVDPRLAALTNRLVGNDPGSALIETCGGLILRARGAVLIANSTELAPTSLGPGEDYRGGSDPLKLWQYVAVRGGFDVPPVLGSRSTDTLSGLGPAPLSEGDLLVVGPEPGNPVAVDHATAGHAGDSVRLGPGPRLDWFERGSFERLLKQPWVVTDSSRVGVRLSGVRLTRTVTHDLPSEGLVRGAVQVPPDSDPVMLLADHPTTGGYPVIAVVHPDDVAIVAHTSPGGRVRFRALGSR